MLVIMSLIPKSDGVKSTQIAEMTLRIAHDYVAQSEMHGFMAPLVMSFQRLDQVMRIIVC